MVAPSRCRPYARSPDTTGLPPIETVTVPSSMGRAVAPVSSDMRRTSMSRLSMSSLALPPETVTERIELLSSAMPFAVVLTSVTRALTWVRISVHCVSTAW